MLKRRWAECEICRAKLPKERESANLNGLYPFPGLVSVEWDYTVS